MGESPVLTRCSPRGKHGVPSLRSRNGLRAATPGRGTPPLSSSSGRCRGAMLPGDAEEPSRALRPFPARAFPGTIPVPPRPERRGRGQLRLLSGGRLMQLWEKLSVHPPVPLLPAPNRGCGAARPDPAFYSPRGSGAPGVAGPGGGERRELPVRRQRRGRRRHKGARQPPAEGPGEGGGGGRENAEPPGPLPPAQRAPAPPPPVGPSPPSRTYPRGPGRAVRRGGRRGPCFSSRRCHLPPSLFPASFPPSFLPSFLPGCRRGELGRGGAGPGHPAGCIPHLVGKSFSRCPARSSVAGCCAPAHPRVPFPQPHRMGLGGVQRCTAPESPQNSAVGMVGCAGW